MGELIRQKEGEGRRERRSFELFRGEEGREGGSCLFLGNTNIGGSENAVFESETGGNDFNNLVRFLLILRGPL